MIRKWHTMALPVLALVIGISGVSSTNVWAEERGLFGTLKQLIWAEQAEPLATELSIVLGATITPMIGIDPEGKEIHRVYPSVTRYIDLDEDGAEIGRVAIVAPEKLNLVQGRKYQLKIVNASTSTHYFWAPEFDELSAETKRLTVDAGKIRDREVGAPGEQYLVAETEIQPGGTAVWEFVPQMAGKFKWGCSIPMHDQAGMKGEFAVAPAITG